MPVAPGATAKPGPVSVAVTSARPASFGRLRAFVLAHPDALSIGLIVVVAAAIRFAFAFRVPVFLLRDSVSYFLPAWDLNHGLGFDLSVRRTPVYPWFLSGAMTLFGDELLAVALAQHALGIGTAVLVYLLGRLTFGRAAGLLAALLTALNGALLVAEHYVMPEAVLLALLLVTLYALLLAIRHSNRRSFLTTGLLLGMCILCKPVTQALVPVLPLIVLASRGSLRRAIVPSALIGAGVLAVIVPWMARNAAVHGSATTAGALGQTLVARAAKHDDGFTWYDARQAAAYERREGIARQIVQSGIKQRLSDGVIYRRVQDRLGLSDPDVNHFMRDLTVKVILEQPGYYLRGTAEMTWRLLLGEVEKLSTDWKTQNARLSREEWDDRVEYLLSRATDAQRNELDRASAVVGLVQPAALGPILPLLGLLGMVVAVAVPRLRPALTFGLVTAALLVTSAALDGPVTRYRYPTDPLVALAAAGGLIWGLTWLLSWTRPRRATPSATRTVAHRTPTPAAGTAPESV
ncbi:MAG: glycosyltransferase family 39 protein [Chloroflexi bacterium]|nr:glycosyltransferase family 39 protein [Chloroflexota bacterium]